MNNIHEKNCIKKKKALRRRKHLKNRIIETAILIFIPDVGWVHFRIVGDSRDARLPSASAGSAMN